MDIKPEDSAGDINLRQRKFGLPDWMVNNMERLNFATDFEQYACSPPESEGFLTEYKENQDAPQINKPSNILVRSKTTPDICLKKIIQVNVESDEHPSKLVNKPIDQLANLCTSLSSIKNEEMFSSPDSTPCATPEPSPVVRRKMSNPSDTVITNPGRWFYLGKVNVQKKINESDVKNTENSKSEERSQLSTSNAKDAILNAKKNGIKLMISNFDLNAVSPTSW